jgi:hypothetical protein
MLSKLKVGTPMSGLLAVKRGFGLLAFLLIGLAANAYGNPPSTVPISRSNVPEIATGAAITASLLAGGGLLLLADRLRGKKKSKS